MIAAAAADGPNSGWSRSAMCSTRLAKTDMGEPSGVSSCRGPGATDGRDGVGKVGMTTRAQVCGTEGSVGEMPCEVP